MKSIVPTTELVSSLKKETTLLRDELRVREQMLIATANMLHRANEELMQLRAIKQKQESEDTEAMSAEIISLKEQLEAKEQMMHDWRQKVKEAIKENKRKEQEQEQENQQLQVTINDLQSQMRELQFLKRTREIEKTDQETQTVGLLFAGSGGQADYSSVEGRLGSNSATEVRQWILQAENADKAASLLKGSSNSRAGSTATTITPRPLTVILTPPSRRGFRSNSRGPGQGGASQSQVRGTSAASSTNLLQHGVPQFVTSPLNDTDVGLPPHDAAAASNNQQQQQGGDGDNFASPSGNLLTSPPPKIPELPASELQSAPPIIVSIFYGTADGWSVDTKLAVQPGQTVGDLITITCEKVNQRYGKNLDCSNMCLRTHHPRAQRWVTIRDHRSVHSFAYFLRCATQSDPIKLQLEPLSAAELARRQSSLRQQQQQQSSRQQSTGPSVSRELNQFEDV